MADDIRKDPYEDEPDFLTALKLVRRRKTKVKHAKAEASQVRTLNITAMMDMMTILLVFLLKSVSFSAAVVNSGDALSLPMSSTKDEIIESVKIFVAKQYIIVEDQKVAEIKDGQIVPSYLSGDNNYLVPNLREALGKEIDRQLHIQKRLAGIKQFEFQGNLTVIADLQTTYETLIKVIYTSGQSASLEDPSQKASFYKFRLTVKKQSEGL